MIRIIFALIIIIILAVMAMANQELFQISYILGSTSPLPLYLILMEIKRQGRCRPEDEADLNQLLVGHCHHGKYDYDNKGKNNSNHYDSSLKKGKRRS